MLLCPDWSVQYRDWLTGAELVLLTSLRSSCIFLLKGFMSWSYSWWCVCDRNSVFYTCSSPQVLDCLLKVHVRLQQVVIFMSWIVKYDEDHWKWKTRLTTMTCYWYLLYTVFFGLGWVKTSYYNHKAQKWDHVSHKSVMLVHFRLAGADGRIRELNLIRHAQSLKDNVWSYFYQVEEKLGSFTWVLCFMSSIYEY